MQKIILAQYFDLPALFTKFQNVFYAAIISGVGIFGCGCIWGLAGCTVCLGSTNIFFSHSPQFRSVATQSVPDRREEKKTFWRKGFQILQNIQDQMTLDQNMKRAKDFIANHTTCQAPDEAASKDPNTRDDNVVEDILKFCKQRR